MGLPCERLRFLRHSYDGLRLRFHCILNYIRQVIELRCHASQIDVRGSSALMSKKQLYVRQPGFF